MIRIWYMKQLPILFSHNDVLDLYPTMSSFSSFVFRSAKRGSVKQIKRGLYALVDPSTGNIYATPFQIVSRLFDDSYFSYHEALEYYGLANQSFVSRFTYLAHTYAKDFEFNGVTYKAKKSPCNLQTFNRMREEGVRVVSLERAIVDSIDCPSLAGGLEEIEYALDNAPELDIQLVVQLLEHYNKNILYQKAGYLFEKHFGGKIPNEFYKKCFEHVGNKIVYFESRVGQAKLNTKWKLMIEDQGGLPDELF
jgi:predicted transcriptional regulator of viral defense system